MDEQKHSENDQKEKKTLVKLQYRGKIKEGLCKLPSLQEHPERGTASSQESKEKVGKKAGQKLQKESKGFLFIHGKKRLPLK